MTSYNLDGFYVHDNKRKFIKGSFEVNNDSLEGKICDYTANEKFIKGHLNRKEGLITLSFLKMFNKSSSNVLFQLEKFDSKSFLGEYVGEWGLFPYLIKYDPESKLYLAKLDLNHAKTKNKARLILS